jgi:hypothetical protein
MTRAHAPLLFVLLSPACSPANSLQGSMSELVSLGFNQVTVKLAQNQLVVSYLETSDGGSLSMPFQLAVDAPDGGFSANSTLLVSGLAQDGGSDAGAIDAGATDGGDGGPPVEDGGVLVYAVANRSVSTDPRPFSPIDRGHIDINEKPVVGKPVSGDFFVVFTYQTDGSLGSGRTVYGNFSATVTQ